MLCVRGQSRPLLASIAPWPSVDTHPCLPLVILEICGVAALRPLRLGAGWVLCTWRGLDTGQDRVGAGAADGRSSHWSSPSASGIRV